MSRFNLSRQTSIQFHFIHTVANTAQTQTDNKQWGLCLCSFSTPFTTDFCFSTDPCHGIGGRWDQVPARLDVLMKMRSLIIFHTLLKVLSSLVASLSSVLLHAGAAGWGWRPPTVWTNSSESPETLSWWKWTLSRLSLKGGSSPNWGLSWTMTLPRQQEKNSWSLLLITDLVLCEASSEITVLQ